MIAFALCLVLSQQPAEAEQPAEPPAEAAQPPAARAAEIEKAFEEETPRAVRIELNDGRVVSGKLLMRDDLQMLVETEDGQPVHIDAEEVKRYTEPLGNKNRSRYLFAGSALMPDVGQVTVTQVQVLATIFEVGAAQHFSFQLGTAVPAYFLGSEGVNAYAGVKAGSSFFRWLHVALELKLLVVGALARLGGPGTSGVPATALADVALTFGNEDINVTVAAGPPIHLSQLTRPEGRTVGLPLFTFSAFVRVANNVGLLTENWFIPDADPTDGNDSWFIADALGARFFGQRWAVDLGILVMPSQFRVQSAVPGVLPWLNFSWHFS